MLINPDYVERVYAGVLGKIIGVYLGRPFEGWKYQRIMDELGPIRYYVNDRLGRPLVVADDDISGTLTFLRAMPDYGNSRSLTSQQIGWTWLNYLVEERAVLWWGGLGNSTEHTAYLRLKNGIDAPASGSIETNGRIVAEQIGAQIFVDGWAMVSPGDPDLAADLAGRAARVSHDGEAVYGAQVIAAMEALAFVEPRLETLIDEALRLIPPDSTISTMIGRIREIHSREPDWQKGWHAYAADYNYENYGGNCHMVPNHGIIILGLLYGGDDFQETLCVVNSCGYDTDCNSGNAGCLLGIKNGLSGIDGGPDWRGPVADRLYVPGADGGRAVSDAVTETYRIAASGRALAKQEQPPAPKDGARFHFSLPGSVQGFRPESTGMSLANTVGPHGERCLALSYDGSGDSARVGTYVFLPPEDLGVTHYGLLASPALYAGQLIAARVLADRNNTKTARVSLYLKTHAAVGVKLLTSTSETLEAGGACEIKWKVPTTGGRPLFEIGVQVDADEPGTVYLDRVGWSGEPDLVLIPQDDGGEQWMRAWVNGVDGFRKHRDTPYRINQNSGTGLLIQGARDWRDYRVESALTIFMAKNAGVAVRVQGLRRYYALTVGDDGVARLLKELDGTTVLAEAPCTWIPGDTVNLVLSANGSTLTGTVDGKIVLRATDNSLVDGGAALLCEEGTIGTDQVRVSPS